MVSHNSPHRGKGVVTRTMAGKKACVGIVFHQSASQVHKFFCALMIVEKMEASHNRAHIPGASCEDILQSAMCTTCKQQAVNVESYFMTEIVLY